MQMLVLTQSGHVTQSTLYLHCDIRLICIACKFNLFVLVLHESGHRPNLNVHGLRVPELPTRRACHPA